jgi:carotenoid cleavage dioxygenase-like enzyme
VNAVARLTKRVLPELRAAIAALSRPGDNIPVALAHLEHAQETLHSVTKRGPRKVLVLPGRTADERRAEHRSSTGSLRAQVAARSGGRCEVSGVEVGPAWDLHHLDAGGHRRSRQSLDNCLAVSFDVHRLLHRGDLATLRSVKEACLRLGLRDGLRAIEHRLAKITEARGSVRIAVEGT